METYRWHQQTSLKNFYEAEIGVLKRGLNGDFKLIKLFDPDQQNGRVVAIGALKYNDNHEQEIQIIFPTKYPSSSPKIQSVKVQYDKENNISGLSARHFRKGNQYENGEMCLLRKDEWNLEEHNIGWTLRQAQKWLCYANSEDGFPPDEIVEEIPLPFNQSGQVLLPKGYLLPKNSKTGQFILKKFKPNHYILEHNILPSSPFSLQLGIDTFEWYSFDTGIKLKDIPVTNLQELMNFLEKNFGKNPMDGKSNFNFAFHVPGETNPWHFFQLTQAQLGAVQLNYLIARNIDNELYLRTRDIFDESILKNKRVTVIGLGALGSEVSRSLARNAIGHFNLFDNDKFEIGNSVRHAADLFYIGEPKVDVVKQLILRSNPNITVNTFGNDVLDDNGRLEESLSNSDICIVLTGEDSVDYMMNDFYMPNYEIPFVFAGVAPGGLTGAIQVVKYQQTPCLRCLSIKKADKLPKPKTEIKFNVIPPEYGNCTSPALPGSEIDTKEIALQVSRVVMQELLRDEKSVYPASKGNQYYWHGPMGSDEKDPFTWEIRNQRKHPECNICGSTK